MVAVGAGWYVTVGKTLGGGVKATRVQMMNSFNQTVETVTKEGNPIAPAQQKFQEIKGQIQENVKFLKEETNKDSVSQQSTAQIKSDSKEQSP